MPRLLRTVPVLLLVASLASLLAPRAQTVPLYAARTGALCQQCHFDPNGGGPRNDFGFMFARNRHSIQPEDSGPWKDLSLTNKIGDTMPVYLGLNYRFMLIGGTSAQKDSLDRFAFFNMENAIYVTFQPHQALTFVYTADAFTSNAFGGGVRSKDAYGLINLPYESYLKVGKFRNPFGLRMDDHTVATRNSFLDFSTGERFLPYDPRIPDLGVEYGLVRGPVFGRVAFTNGQADPFSSTNPFAQTVAGKLGYNMPAFQVGASIYDDFEKHASANIRRMTRWGGYGLTHKGPFAFLGEIDAGTDAYEADLGGGSITKYDVNQFAWFLEGDYAPRREFNLRLRADHFVPNHSGDEVIREQNTHDRYALEGEWVPVPFAELRATLRVIDHKDNATFGFEDERQFYLQAHFSY